MVDHDAVRRRVEALLAGPRGREVCAVVAHEVDPGLEVPHEATEETTDRLVSRLARLDVEPLALLEDPLTLLDALGTAVDSARYWQESSDRDAVLAVPAVAELLEPVAAALAVAPAARWWWSPVPLAEQAVVGWLEQGRLRSASPLLHGAADRLQQWRADAVDEEERAARERPEDPSAAHSGRWWSTPVFAGLLTTSRRLGRLPAVQLELVEDSMGWGRARVAPVEVVPGVRVLEITAASDWAALVSRCPLDVDRSRRHDWYRATGGTGPWQIPDWAEVGRDHDAVHLTVAAYLEAAGRALPTDDGWTVLAGFDPDLTYWLTDAVASTGPPTTWSRTELDDGEHAWAR